MSRTNAPAGPEDAGEPIAAFSRRSRAAQALGRIDPITRGVVPPLHVATTFIRDPDNAYASGFSYARPDNATVRETEAVLAMLEEAGAGALLFGSGMAAATAVFGALEPGDHVVAPNVMYWALKRWLREEVAPTFDAMVADPARGLSAESVFSEIRAHHAERLKGHA